MNRRAAIVAICACGLSGTACDTFRGLDGVARPFDLTDAALPIDGGDDAGEDIPDVDGDVDGDVDRDMNVRDTEDDLELGVGDMRDVRDAADDGADTDVSVPPSCPSASSTTPTWSTEPIDSTAAFIATPTPTAAFVSATATPFLAPDPRFVIAYRFESNEGGGKTESRLARISPDGIFNAGDDSFLLFFQSQDGLDFADVVVAPSQEPSRAAFLAITKNPTCSGTGIESLSGVTDDTGGFFGRLGPQSSNTLEAACGSFRPRAALTGAQGKLPNMRLLHDTNGLSKVLGYRWDDDSISTVERPADLSEPHISATNEDMVVSSDIGGGWRIWQTSADENQDLFPLSLVGTTSPEVQHVDEGCHALAAADGAVLRLGAVDCLTDRCAWVEAGQLSPLAGDVVHHVDVAPLPNGSFVVGAVVSDTGGDYHVETFWLNEAFELVRQETVHTDPLPITDLALATTWDGTTFVVGAFFAVPAGAAMGIHGRLLRVGP